MKALNMVSPWIEYYKQVEALFKKDPSVKVAYDDESKTIFVYVKGQAKADALAELLPESKDFGNVTINVNIIPANEKKSMEDILHDAFDGNDAKSFIYVSPGPVLAGLAYVVFRPEIAQYFGDNLQDINGNCSWLYQDLAKAVFRDDLSGVAFCTESTEYELSKPLGEWP